MAVTGVWRKGVSSRDGQWSDDRSGAYTLTLGVGPDDPLTGEPLVLAAVAALYPLYSAYPGDALALVKSIKARQEEFPLRWEAEVEWSTLTANEAQQVDDPRTKPAMRSWSVEDFTEAVEYDVNGDAVVNAAGEPFEGGLDLEQSRLVMTVKKNMATVDPADVSANYL